MRNFLCAFSIVSLSFLAAAASAEGPRIWSYDELPWQSDKSLPSVKSVDLWGDPKTGEHAMLRRFPAGFAPPPHRHPSTERVVVVSGSIAVRYAGSEEKRLGPGSYSEIPANTEHAVKCLETADCVFVLSSPGPFAIIPSKKQ